MARAPLYPRAHYGRSPGDVRSSTERTHDRLNTLATVVHYSTSAAGGAVVVEAVGDRHAVETRGDGVGAVGAVAGTEIRVCEVGVPGHVAGECIYGREEAQDEREEVEEVHGRGVLSSRFLSGKGWCALLDRV